MERSTANITYKGTVPEAVQEAQRQKKLFVVYISGEDEDSTRLEQSVWADNSVVESISKYCIFLHLMHRSIEALQFSAIFPQKSVPSITAIGYNGVMLWQHEGYTNVENFVANIEKAWASLHIQETTVTLLTAALASKKPEALESNSQESPQENTSAFNTGSTSAAKSSEKMEDEPTNDSDLPSGQMITESIDNNDALPGLETSSQSSNVNDEKVKGEDQNMSDSNKIDEIPCTVTRDIPIATKETFLEPSRITAVVEGKKVKTEVAELAGCSNTVKLNDINLNIRLPNGASLQRKFMVTDTLRSVKQYVDENQISGIGSYDLAVPYPRKLFNEQDMNSNLSELGFAARQALIVVPHRQAIKPSLMPNTENSTSAVNSTNDNSLGYFAFVKRVLSYVNPFSYLGSTNSSNSEPTPSDSYHYQQYRPNDALQGRLLSGTASSSHPFSQSQQNPSANENASEIRRRTSRPFGSNIHTLKHDEDDFQSRDKNAFWNGNSTQFGGDDKK